MLTIIGAGIRTGYSRNDHLNNDSDAQQVIGRTARTLAEARRIVARAAGPGNTTKSPTWVTCRNQFGDIIEG